jgi:hypothetical protein
MSEQRKKSSIWPSVVALLIGLPVLYVASFGPMCWLTARDRLDTSPVHPAMLIYIPFGMILDRFNGASWPSKSVVRWATLLVPKGRIAAIPYRANCQTFWGISLNDSAPAAK